MRIKLNFEQEAIFTTQIPVRITDINFGGHLGNDSLLSIIHEARVKWLHSINFSEINIGGCGMIMAESIIQYKAESFYGDLLQFEISINDVSSSSFNIQYKISTKRNTNRILIALARTTMISYDYNDRKITPIPSDFLQKIIPQNLKK